MFDDKVVLREVEDPAGKRTGIFVARKPIKVAGICAYDERLRTQQLRKAMKGPCNGFGF